MFEREGAECGEFRDGSVGGGMRGCRRPIGERSSVHSRPLMSLAKALAGRALAGGVSDGVLLLDAIRRDEARSDGDEL